MTTTAPNFGAQAAVLWALHKRDQESATLEEIQEDVRAFTPEDQVEVARIAGRLLEDHLADRSRAENGQSAPDG